MRVLFIGTEGAFSYIPLKAVQAKHQIAGIVSTGKNYYAPAAEEKPGIFKYLVRSFRHFKPAPFLESYAAEHNLPFFCLVRANRDDLPGFVRTCQPDIICSAAGPILKKEVFSVPPYGAINFHPALLPKYRGPNPWFWQYYFMEAETGATIHYIDEGEDTGDIIKQERILIDPDISPQYLAHRVITAGGRLMAEALDEIEAGTVNSMVQRDQPCPFRARRVNSDENLVDWENWPIEKVWHVLRGTWAWVSYVPIKAKGLKWTVEDYCPGKADGSPGSFKLKAMRGYFCHPQGRIYVRPYWSFKNWVREWLSL